MIRTLLLILLLPALASTAVATAGETWLAESGGQIVISPEGRVTAVDFKRSFGAEIDEALKSQIHAWRFEPITEQGKAVEAVAHMNLRLQAEFEGSRQGKVRIVDARFIDPPDPVKAAADTEARKAPRYPERALRGRNGALLTMRVEVDDSGRVVNAAGLSSWLTGPAVSPREQERLMQAFVKASRKAMLDWQMPLPSESGSHVYTVPISFRVGGQSSPWQRVHWVMLPPEPWMLRIDPANIAELDEQGRPARSDLRLLTELEPAQGPSS